MIDTPQTEAAAPIDPRLLEQGIKPHADELAPIMISGEVAVLAFEPDVALEPALRAVGWNARAVFRLATRWRTRLAQGSDPVTRAWLARSGRDVGRILVFWGAGTLLVNYTPATGYTLEPGSIASERQRAEQSGGATPSGTMR